MSKKRTHGKLLDIGMTVVLVAFAVGIVGLVTALVWDSHVKKEKEKEASATATPVVTAQATTAPTPKESDLTRYSSIIAKKGKEEESGSAFYLELNEKTGTYEQLLCAGTSRSVLNHGTFEKQEDGIRTINKDKQENIWYYEGKYLISGNSLYDGKVPEGKTFDKTFTSVVDDESKVEIVFKKDGTFTQNIVRYAAGLDGSDAEDDIKGTYEREGKFIRRKKEDGTETMPLYVYKGQLCTSYYKLEKEAEKK